MDASEYYFRVFENKKKKNAAIAFWTAFYVWKSWNRLKAVNYDGP